MPTNRLKDYLDENRVRYSVIVHSPAFTAQETAAFAHVPGRELAKTVMVKIDEQLAMLILPAPDRVSLEGMREATGARQVELAAEWEFRRYFPDCELGAMPPFGNLYGMDVYVTKRLTENVHIFFNAGSHRELIRMPYRDFERLVRPTLLHEKQDMGLSGGGVGQRDRAGGSGIGPTSARHAPADAVTGRPTG